MIYNKKYIFGFHYQPPSRVPKTLGISEVMKAVVCYVNEVTFELYGRMKDEAGCLENQPGLEG